MNGRALVIIVAGIILVSGTAFMQMASKGNDMSKNVDLSYVRTAAKNIAESAASMGVRKINDDPTWRSSLGPIALLGGNGFASAKDTFYMGKPAIQVMGLGSLATGNDVVEEHTFAYLPGDTTSIPAPVNSKHDVDKEHGFEVDGRDHDCDGHENHETEHGRDAIHTEKECHQDDPDHIHGCEGDVETDCRTHPDVVKSGTTCTDHIPSTPDSVISSCGHHCSEGDLKEVAKSCEHGSQYTSDPLTLHHPLSGVTYVELPDGGCWDNANVEGTGILVVHNATGNSCVKNLSGSGFSGLIIADGIVRTNTIINGAVLTNGVLPDSIAIGTGTIQWSRKAVASATGLFLRSAKRASSRQGVIAWR
jgi:hypothetical protein